MTSVDITFGVWRLRATAAGELTPGQLEAVWMILQVLTAGVPLLRFRFEAEGGTGLIYRYRIWLTDGRTWDQTLTFSNATDPDPTLTFSVSPGWKLSEFQPHRSLRDQVIALRNVSALSLLRVDAT